MRPISGFDKYLLKVIYANFGAFLQKWTFRPFLRLRQQTKMTETFLIDVLGAYWRTHAEWESTSCIISTILTYSVLKTSSSFSSRLMHGSFWSVFLTIAQSVNRRMLLGCHKHANLCQSYPCPGSIAMIQIAFLHSSIFCASFASTWCSFRSLYNLSMYLWLGLRGFFLPTFIVAISLAALF